MKAARPLSVFLFSIWHWEISQHKTANNKRQTAQHVSQVKYGVQITLIASLTSSLTTEYLVN